MDKLKSTLLALLMTALSIIFSMSFAGYLWEATGIHEFWYSSLFLIIITVVLYIDHDEDKKKWKNIAKVLMTIFTCLIVVFNGLYYLVYKGAETVAVAFNEAEIKHQNTYDQESNFTNNQRLHEDYEGVQSAGLEMTDCEIPDYIGEQFSLDEMTSTFGYLAIQPIKYLISYQFGEIKTGYAYRIGSKNAYIEIEYRVETQSEEGDILYDSKASIKPNKEWADKNCSLLLPIFNQIAKDKIKSGIRIMTRPLAISESGTLIDNLPE